MIPRAMPAVADATSSVSHARQVKGDDRQKGRPWHSRLGLGVRLTTPPHKKKSCYETSRK